MNDADWATIRQRLKSVIEELNRRNSQRSESSFCDAPDPYEAGRQQQTTQRTNQIDHPDVSRYAVGNLRQAINDLDEAIRSLRNTRDRLNLALDNLRDAPVAPVAATNPPPAKEYT